MQDGRTYRNLTDREIQTLCEQVCGADDWQQVTVVQR